MHKSCDFCKLILRVFFLFIVNYILKYFLAITLLCKHMIREFMSILFIEFKGSLNDFHSNMIT